MNIEKLLMQILPFLFSALRKAFDKKPHEQQMAMINGSMLAQVIRRHYDGGYLDIITAAQESLGWMPAETDKVLEELIRRRGWEVFSQADIAYCIAAILKTLPEQSTQDGFFSGIAGEIAMILAEWSQVIIAKNAKDPSEIPDALSWKDLSSGLLEFAYRRYVKPLIK